MILTTITYIIIYLIGCILSFTLISKSNQDSNEDKTIPTEGVLIWSLLSWIFVLMAVIALGLIQMTESQAFKELKAYFEENLDKDTKKYSS